MLRSSISMIHGFATKPEGIFHDAKPNHAIRGGPKYDGIRKTPEIEIPLDFHILVHEFGRPHVFHDESLHNSMAISGT